MNTPGVFNLIPTISSKNGTNVEAKHPNTIPLKEFVAINIAMEEAPNPNTDLTSMQVQTPNPKNLNTEADIPMLRIAFRFEGYISAATIKLVINSTASYKAVDIPKEAGLLSSVFPKFQ